MTNVPKLNPGQVSLVRCDVNTGHILKTNGELYMQIGDIYQTFDSMDMAETFISNCLQDNRDMEFIVYGHEGEPILIWNRFEKKRIGVQ